MDSQSTLVKTEKGADEIKTRKYKLDHRMRALLLVVNGENTVGVLTRDFSRYGDVLAMLQQLLSDGFIKPEMSLQQLRLEVSAAVYGALGPNSADITQDVENCASLPELRSYLASRREFFAKALGDQSRFEAFWAKLTDLTS